MESYSTADLHDRCLTRSLWAARARPPSLTNDPAILQPVLARFAPGWGADIDCAQGWWPILADLDRQIAAIAPDYRVHQIMEKFGGLHFYYVLDEVRSGPRIDDLIEAAEQVAARTCELCGAPGRPRSGGWIKTFCDAHASSR